MQSNIYRNSIKNIYGLIARLQFYILVITLQFDIESCKPVYFPSDYIEKKQKSGGVHMMNIYPTDSENFTPKTHALSKADNVDLTSVSFSLENYISFSGCMYTSEMDVRGNIESKLEQFFWN